MPFYWGSADGEQSGMAAVRKSFALVIGFLTHCRFCCYSLSMTFNEEFTDTGFGLQSELREKMKKVVVPIAREMTISLLDWAALRAIGDFCKNSSEIQSCLHSSVCLCICTEYTYTCIYVLSLQSLWYSCFSPFIFSNRVHVQMKG